MILTKEKAKELLEALDKYCKKHKIIMSRNKSIRYIELAKFVFQRYKTVILILGNTRFVCNSPKFLKKWALKESLKNIRPYMRSRLEYLKNKWLFDCGERIKYLANLKNDVVKDILHVLRKERTITFCKTIEQAECLSRYCIHSKNKSSDDIYNNFNAKRINHIASVNVLNEGANLVDCKYAVFANYSSSEICSVQRIGRSLRHKSPVIIMPYYENTREQEILENMLKDFNKESTVTVHSLDELKNIVK